MGCQLRGKGQFDLIISAEGRDFSSEDEMTGFLEVNVGISRGLEEGQTEFLYPSCMP